MTKVKEFVEAHQGSPEVRSELGKGSAFTVLLPKKHPEHSSKGKKVGLKVTSTTKIIAVEAKNMYNFGEGLNDEMKKAIPAIIEKVREF